MNPRFANLWTPAEDAIIADNWHSGKPTASWSHLLPGRTCEAIAKRGRAAGLGKRERILPLVWTQEHDDHIRRLWPTGERFKAHMELFGDHSYYAIMNRAYELGLGKRPNCPRGQAPIAWILIERELKKGSVDPLLLAAAVNLHPSTVYEQIRIAHSKGLIHIVDWKRRSSGGKPIPVYAVGPGQDAPMPARLSNAETCRLSRTRKRAASNPFAVAAGLVSAMPGRKGRVIRNLDELEAA